MQDSIYQKLACKQLMGKNAATIASQFEFELTTKENKLQSHRQATAQAGCRT